MCVFVSRVGFSDGLGMNGGVCVSVGLCVFVCVSVLGRLKRCSSMDILAGILNAVGVSQTTVLTDGSERLSWPVMSVGYGYKKRTNKGVSTT